MCLPKRTKDDLTDGDTLEKEITKVPRGRETEREKKKKKKKKKRERERERERERGEGRGAGNKKSNGRVKLARIREETRETQLFLRPKNLFCELLPHISRIFPCMNATVS